MEGVVCKDMEWLEAMVAERDQWAGWEHVFGPSAQLFGCGSSILANWIWGRMIGDVACGWRLAYSPDGPAFGIWGVIYIWTALSILFQFLTNMNDTTWYCAPFGANALMGGAWLACSLWIWFFSLADSKNVRDGLGWAALCLVTAAGCALSAVIWERSWAAETIELVRILTVGVPYALFAGWLTVAASLSVGVYVASETRDPDENCEKEDELRILRAEGNDRYVPLVVAVAVFAVGVGLPDPVLFVPLGWGVFWMVATVPTRAALGVAVIGAGVATARVAVS